MTGQGEGDEVMAGLARWRDELGGVAGDKVPTHCIPEGVVQDPVQLYDRGWRESGPHQFAVELVEMPRSEPGQSHLPMWGTAWHRMSCSYLIQVRGPTEGSTLRSQARRNCMACKCSCRIGIGYAADSS